MAAAATSPRMEAESCDTGDNDSMKADEWWRRLKHHMDLSGDDEGGQTSQEPTRKTSFQGLPNHTDEQIQCWEAERQDLQREREEELAEQLKFEKEEEDIKRDEQRLAQHEASTYRDWEQWVVLNTPATPKRRRLTITAHGGQTATQVPAQTSLQLPPEVDRLDRFRVTLQVDNNTTSVLETATGEQNDHLPLDVTGKVYARAYEAWRAGSITDSGVETILGPDWLFMFRVNMEGVPGDTLPAGPSSGEMERPMEVGSTTGPDGFLVGTQLDLDSEGQEQWGHELRGAAAVLELEDSVEEGRQDDREDDEG